MTVASGVRPRPFSATKDEEMLTFARSDMLVNLLDTFGLVPQAVYPESTNSSATGRLDALLTAKLREYALELRTLHNAALKSLSETHEGRPYGERKALAAQSARKRKEEQLAEVYRILAITLGQPPKPDDKFVWEYYDKKSSKYHRIETTPKQFYKDVGVDVSQALSLVNDPRHEYKTLMTVDRLGNVWGGRPVKYINAEIDVLKETAVKLLKADIPVWVSILTSRVMHNRTADALMPGSSAATSASSPTLRSAS